MKIHNIILKFYDDVRLDDVYKIIVEVFQKYFIKLYLYSCLKISISTIDIFTLPFNILW